MIGDKRHWTIKRELWGHVL